MTLNKRKYNKWSTEQGQYGGSWEQEVTNLVGQEVEHTFQKGDKKLGQKDNARTFALDGAEVTAETGEKVKVNDVELLIAQRKALMINLETQKKNLASKEGFTGTYANLAMRHDKLEESIAEWKTNLKTGKNYTKRYQDFLKKSADAYRIDGWFKLATDYQKKPFTSGATAQEYKTNLYEVNLYTGSGNNQKQIKITEQELIKLITRTLAEIKKIDKDQFANLTTTPPTGIPPLTFTATSADAAAIQGQLTILQAHADKLVETTDEHTGRKEYSFGHGFVKDDETGMKDTPFGKAEIESYFDFLDFLQNNSSWLLNDEVKTKVLKEIPEQTELVFIPAQTEPYTEKQLHNWGYQGYSATSDKKTGFYGSIPKKEWKEQAVKFEIENGLRGWSQLNSLAFQIDYNLNEGRKEQIIGSFDTDLYTTFYNDYRQVIEDTSFGSFTNGGHNYTLLEFPLHFYEQEALLYKLKALMKSEIKRVGTGGDELRAAEEEVAATKKALKDKEAEIDAKITAKVDELRTTLKAEWKISATEYKGFKKNSDTDDNRLTLRQHYELQKLLSDIRFLKNNDTEIDTEIPNENTAIQESYDIILECMCKWYSSSWDSIGWKVDGSEEENRKITTEQRIALIKENKPAADGKKPYDILNLNWWHDSLAEYEKLVKLDDRETEIKTKLKAAIDNQTPEENQQDWQNIVKKYEAGLATVFDQAKIAQWKEKKDGQDAFNNTVGIESLIKKVSIFEKETDGTTDKFKEINPDFLTFLKGKDDKLKTLTDLFKEKDPAEVILYIHQWEFNKLDETKKQERYLKFAWSDLGGKQKVDSKEKLADSEKDNFDKYLYQCAIGKINENSLTKPSEQEETPTENNGNKDKTGVINWLNNHYWWPVWVPLLAIAVIVAIFWKPISDWWNGPGEEMTEQRIEESTDEEEDE